MTGNIKPKLLEQVRQVIRVKHYSLGTEDSYINWIKRFIFFHKKIRLKWVRKKLVNLLLIWQKMKKSPHQCKTKLYVQSYSYIRMY
jgi:hypothetical protein